MILEAIRQEVTGIRRSPVRLTALVVFFAASALALLAGQRFLADWSASLDDAQTLRGEAAQFVFDWFAAGVVGPEDRPWVDVTEPLWQDWYAGTRIGREPAPLAGIATGSLDDSPRVARVHRLANPFLEEGTKIENPELGRTEAIDLIFVLAVFVPLLIGVLGMGCGAYERESGLVRLIAVQRGRASSWFLARAVAIAVVAGIAVLVVALIAITIAGAFNAEGMGLIALALLYTALWAGLFTATAVAARNRREAALAYGGVWVLLVVLAPALMSEHALSSTVEDAGLTTALDQRSQQYEGYAEDATVLVERLYAARPDLTSLPAATIETLPAEIERHVYDWSRVQGLVAEDETKASAERQAIATAERAMAWSPMVTLTLAIERIAGRDLYAAMAFRHEVIGAVAERADWVVEQAWRNEALTLEDFQTLIEGAPTSVRTTPASVTPHMLVLLAWTAIAWMVGVVRVRRREVEV
ncbi:MAG: ABC transporter permease subunit [Acidobacteriota bacterium]